MHLSFLNTIPKACQKLLIVKIMKNYNKITFNRLFMPFNDTNILNNFYNILILSSI